MPAYPKQITHRSNLAHRLGAAIKEPTTPSLYAEVWRVLYLLYMIRRVDGTRCQCAYTIHIIIGKISKYFPRFCFNLLSDIQIRRDRIALQIACSNTAIIEAKIGKCRGVIRLTHKTFSDASKIQLCCRKSLRPRQKNISPSHMITRIDASRKGAGF